MKVTGRVSPDPGDPAGDPRLNTAVPHVARIYDYWLGGKDTFTPDRSAGEEAIAAFPGIRARATS
jgi:hypothetical protein